MKKRDLKMEKERFFCLGKINIGNNAVIGAGSVVFYDIPAHEIWTVISLTLLKKLGLISR